MVNTMCHVLKISIPKQTTAEHVENKRELVRRELSVPVSPEAQHRLLDFAGYVHEFEQCFLLLYHVNLGFRV